jgi:hypothetical protein
MSFSSDSSLMVLPHPVRVDAAFGRPIEDALLRETGILEAVRPYLGAEGVSTEWIINRSLACWSWPWPASAPPPG